jgi:hypothetical protein
MTGWLFVRFYGPLFLTALILFLPVCTHAKDADTSVAATVGTGYRIDKPGTITFTIGVKIKGKVEKPQVMIFLPKEKPVYKKATFSHSFSEDIVRPLPFDPVEK